MKIAIDMDNTLVDELGSRLRPGIILFLEELHRDNELILWTNSSKPRAYEILRYHNIRKYFSSLICREDYDPDNQNLHKDLRLRNADILIDDDPEEIAYNKKNRKKAFLITSFRSSSAVDKDELTNLLKNIRKK